VAEPNKKLRLKLGDVIAERYRIDGVVGRGGFGAVYQATQLSSGAQVALKVLLKNFSSGQTDSKRFQREAALVKKLRHPNVVALLDSGATEGGQPFIAFELLHGQALSTVLKESGALPLERAAQVARGVLHALEAAHSLGIIHRDIKPANVFLCDDHQGVKVLDFGIAKAVIGSAKNATQLTEAGQMIGTPQYMSPEQVRGTGVFPTTDVYAVGLILSEMVTGQRVVQSPALLDVYMQHIDDRPFDQPSKVRDSVIGPIVARAIAKPLADRYGSAAEMGAALDGAVPSPAGVEPQDARTIQMDRPAQLSAVLESTLPLADDRAPVGGVTSPVGPDARSPGTVVMDQPGFDGSGEVQTPVAPASAPGLAPTPPVSSMAPYVSQTPVSQTPVSHIPVSHTPVAVSTPVPSGHSPLSGVPLSGVPLSSTPAPSSYGAMVHHGSGDYGGLTEETYDDDDYPPDSRSDFRTGLTILVVVFALAAAVLAMALWAPWDDASAPREIRDPLVVRPTTGWHDSSPLGVARVGWWRCRPIG